ncbi:hypothetical protein NDN08_003656 [Rhodosorus marinus]|uniref:RING-type domain-containing protein n=1 Tax=Rhodosorus marinus TaxID=101924 RepID=A0AAV8UX70_9RHOD|nr:hypothetical protein NDN08_003656 [Rhodosorus marinus]
MWSGNVVRWIALLVLIDRTACLIVNAPNECGGVHVVSHASALFGPKPTESNVNDEPVFAPYPSMDESKQDASSWKSWLVNRIGTTDRTVLAYLVGRTPWPSARRVLKKSSRSVPASTRDDNASASPEIELLHDGCKPLTEPDDLKAVKSKIAVIARGSCDFGTKVLNMQESGALGAVIVNCKKDGDRLWNMKLNGSMSELDVKIPSVMITYTEWRKIAACRTKALTVSFTEEGEANFDIDYGKDVLTWAMMRGMALWILLQCGFNVVRYKRRNRNLNARYDAISKLGSFIFGDSSAPSSSGQQVQSASDSDEPLCCAICLDDFESGQTARQLACNHVYHKDCIDPWLLQSSSCPICKRVIGELPPPLSNDFYGSVSAV